MHGTTVAVSSLLLFTSVCQAQVQEATDRRPPFPGRPGITLQCARAISSALVDFALLNEARIIGRENERNYAVTCQDRRDGIGVVFYLAPRFRNDGSLVLESLVADGEVEYVIDDQTLEVINRLGTR